MSAGTWLARRQVLAGGFVLLAACTAARGVLGKAPFVRRDGKRLLADREPYRFVGTNMWYAAYLAADAPFGNRARLNRELDRLAALGVTRHA